MKQLVNNVDIYDAESNISVMAVLMPDHVQDLHKRHVCAWCGTLMWWEHGTGVTHGICPECASALREKHGLGRGRADRRVDRVGQK